MEKCIFFGGSKYVIPLLEELKRKFEIELVITTEKESGAVPKFCEENSLHYLSIQRFNKDHKSLIINHKSKVAVLADFGLILPKDILNSFEFGILNIHPSLLPKYRGPTPGQTAILNGDKSTGVSLIKLDDKVDHGDVLIQTKEEIRTSDTAQSLYERLFEIGSNLLDQNIKQYIKGDLKITEQDHKKASFTKILRKNDGYFDLGNPPSLGKLDLMTRAYYPWPGTWTKIRIMNKELRIKFLPEKKVQVEGKKPVSYKDFINGYPQTKEITELLRRLEA